MQTLRREMRSSSAPPFRNQAPAAAPAPVAAGGNITLQQARPLSEVLRPTPLLPQFPRQLPKTVLEAHQQFSSLELSKFENVKMGKSWPNALKQSYSRRVYLEKTLRERAMLLNYPDEMDGRMQRAASNLDAERQNRNDSVSKFIVYLKSLDPKVSKRKRG